MRITGNAIVRRRADGTVLLLGDRLLRLLLQVVSITGASMFTAMLALELIHGGRRPTWLPLLAAAISFGFLGVRAVATRVEVSDKSLLSVGLFRTRLIAIEEVSALRTGRPAGLMWAVRVVEAGGDSWYLPSATQRGGAAGVEQARETLLRVWPGPRPG
jgi:hypothetical protein